MTTASCHCGAIKFEVEVLPKDLNDCNCSICRRYGTLWAYYQRPQVQFAADNGPTDAYVWGDRMLEFHRCRVCGCVTHWCSIDAAYARMGLNGRLLPLEVLAAIPVRRSNNRVLI